MLPKTSVDVRPVPNHAERQTMRSGLGAFFLAITFTTALGQQPATPSPKPATASPSPERDSNRAALIVRAKSLELDTPSQVFAAISFLVIGLSHLGQPKAWVAFYQGLAARGTPGVFLEGFLLLNFGAIIVAVSQCVARSGPAAHPDCVGAGPRPQVICLFLLCGID